MHKETNWKTGAGVTGALMIAGLALGGCGKDGAEAASQPEWAVSVVVAPVAERTLEEKLFLVGSLAAIEEVDLVSEIDARVVEINFEEGEPVSRDQLLIRLDDRKLAVAVAEMRARYDLARTSLERAASLLERQSIPQQDYDQRKAEADSAKALLELAQEQLQDATLTAPYDGVMTERLVSLGQYMSRGQKLASLVVMDPLEAEFNVPERYISQLAIGQQIGIRVEAWPDEAFAGEVVFISPRVDRDSRTVLVKACIHNADRRLKPGMFGQLELGFRARDKALVIPEAAVSYAGDQAMAVVMSGDNRAEFRPVRLGLRLAGEAEVLEGLAAGERVVVEGFQKMGPGSLLQVSPESARYGITSEGN